VGGRPLVLNVSASQRLIIRMLWNDFTKGWYTVYIFKVYLVNEVFSRDMWCRPIPLKMETLWFCTVFTLLSTGNDYAAWFVMKIWKVYGPSSTSNQTWSIKNNKGNPPSDCGSNKKWYVSVKDMTVPRTRSTSEEDREAIEYEDFKSWELNGLSVKSRICQEKY